jgi:hypothetical protein
MRNGIMPAVVLSLNLFMIPHQGLPHLLEWMLGKVRTQ